MEQKKIERINELARKARESELSEAEKAEQKALREEYIAAFRGNLKQQLDGMTLIRPDGTRERLQGKQS